MRALTKVFIDQTRSHFARRIPFYIEAAGTIFYLQCETRDEVEERCAEKVLSVCSVDEEDAPSSPREIDVYYEYCVRLRLARSIDTTNFELFLTSLCLLQVRRP